MLNNKSFSQKISVFHGRKAPEEGLIAGYGAMIEALNLPVPIPDRLVLISIRHKQYQRNNWLVLTPRHQPDENLFAHLVFALKYEGINLLFFKKLFEAIPIEDLVQGITAEPLSQYTRRIWFLYEWLMHQVLPIPDLKDGNYVFLIDEKLQHANSTPVNSGRHRIKNNLPGTVQFCPLIRNTKTIAEYIAQKMDEKTKVILSSVHTDLILRTSAFLLLKDSKASFTIEGETPPQNRAIRWGKAIGEAGRKPLTREELIRLQQIVIEQSRFVHMGFRREGGFVGEHDRETGQPIPDHISARWQDLDSLIEGLIQTEEIAETNHFHPVLAATMIAFGFVFIHPFSDGNGRIHRYLIHHQLALMGFTPQGFVFPVSAAILENLDEYRRVLEHYSHPLLDFIQWKVTEDNNVEVINDTIDYYRYYDATAQVEFLFKCIEHTIQKLIPAEVSYLKKYDRMKAWLDDEYQMPDRMVALLIRFLEQNNGILSKRAREKEFTALHDDEMSAIQDRYTSIFGDEIIE